MRSDPAHANGAKELTTADGTVQGAYPIKTNEPSRACHHSLFSLRNQRCPPMHL